MSEELIDWENVLTKLQPAINVLEDALEDLHNRRNALIDAINLIRQRAKTPFALNEGLQKPHSDNVVILPVVTRLDIPAERVLSTAHAADLDAVLVIGKQKDGAYYFSSSVADGGDVLWQLEWAKAALMRAGGLLGEKE
jgi:hypothetical protein